MKRVTFIDTSTLCELLEVPGKNDQATATQQELRAREDAGQKFVIPITTVIETGNQIAYSKSRGEVRPEDRRAAAERLVELLRSADDSSYIMDRVSWDRAFLDAICNGASTGKSLADLAAAPELGAGDVAILAQRDRFIEGSGFTREEVDLWTLDKKLAAYA